MEKRNKLDTINLIVSKNIKRIRQEKDISLEELSKLSGVSKSMLSQIERGNGNPSLSTLWKIANGMMVPFNALVSQQRAPYEVVRLSEMDPIIEADENLKNYIIFSGDENQRFSVYYIEVQPGYSWTSEMHMRGTIEFITVFSGKLQLKVGENTFCLERGESIRFKADAPHAYQNLSQETLIFHNILYNS
jgi:transcriptional regulator with XRE-family HTH domain